MSAYVYADGVLVESWDDDTRTYTDHRTDTSRPYTGAENTAADQAAAQAVLEGNRRTVTQALDDSMAVLQALLEATNATIRDNPAPYIKDLARNQRRIVRVLNGHFEETS